MFLYVMQMVELKIIVDNLEKERDFYFAKLRDIDIFCQTPGVENIPVQLQLLSFTKHLNMFL